MTAPNIKNIAKEGYEAVTCVELVRSAIMSCVKAAASATNTSNVTIQGSSYDISTGAGALVLDDALQELSTVEQAAAQIVAAENRAQKQIHSVTGQ